MSHLMLLMLVAMASSQETTTADYTVTYNPEYPECLPYDGSVVPDC